MVFNNFYVRICHQCIFFFNYFLKCIYFKWMLIILQYCSGFCHTLTWINNGCTCVSHHEPPSHLLPHPIPQGHPSAPALSTLSHSSNLDASFRKCVLISSVWVIYFLCIFTSISWCYYLFFSSSHRCIMILIVVSISIFLILMMFNNFSCVYLLSS